MNMRITVLGCGPSGGVPRIGNDWGACDPGDPRNRRRRCSLLLETATTVALIDTSPDLREQLLAAGVCRLDGVAWTHAHADHLNGIDDLRALNRLMNRPLPAWADAETLAEIDARFGYVFDPVPEGGHYYKPALAPCEITGPFQIGDIDFQPFLQDHGYSSSLGFRFGKAAYSTDAVRLNQAAFDVLAGIDLWIVDCFRLHPEHPTHAVLATALEWIERIKPKRAVLTHMGEKIDYRSLAAMLPLGVEPAYDGMVLHL